MKTINLDNLTTGMEIPLNINEQGKYDFKLNNITSDTINGEDSFVYGAETSTIADHDSNVIGANNIYRLDNEQIVDATFAENNPNYNKNFYPSQVDDKMLFDAYVNLITNYGETADFNILNKDQYRVERNEVTGTMNLSLIFGDKLIEHSFTGFKSMGQKIPDIDGSVDKFNISGVDLSNGEIIKLLELNHFNSYVANSLNYDVIEDDSTRGIATVQVVGCNDPDLHDIYINQTFKINNLQPYFIKQEMDIDASLYKITPNKITMDQFKEYFINMSPEFQNRNLDNLVIELVPTAKTLVGNISYKEGTTDQTVTMTFTYDGFHQRKFNMLII
ncbi:hypothetical protein FACS1894166_03020 [Bacilli bacterium]|nr:hypothetical protein FACS1894166_03020 [Bacilli bacterium]